jgi:hypothetical protein
LSFWGNCIAEEESLISILGKSVDISGAVEVEVYSMDYKSKEDEDAQESDITLATVELGLDVNINEYTKGHLLFLWEEDDTEPVDLDEGTITIGAVEDIPFYLSAGKMYVPFGVFNSHFVSDPIILEIGETRESAVLVGYTNDHINLSIGSFNGDVDEIDKDNKIESFIASASGTWFPQDSEDFSISLGASYISNIADSNGLEAEVTNSELESYIPGVGGFLSICYQKLSVEAEYIGASDKFEAGELSFDNGEEIQPAAWNCEVAHMFTEKLEIAARYEGSQDLWDFQPESQYGMVVSYNLFENTTVALEYLHGEYKNGDEQNITMMQMAIEF